MTFNVRPTLPCKATQPRTQTSTLMSLNKPSSSNTSKSDSSSQSQTSAVRNLQNKIAEKAVQILSTPKKK